MNQEIVNSVSGITVQEINQLERGRVFGIYWCTEWLEFRLYLWTLIHPIEWVMALDRTH